MNLVENLFLNFFIVYILKYFLENTNIIEMEQIFDKNEKSYQKKALINEFSRKFVPLYTFY